MTPARRYASRIARSVRYRLGLTKAPPPWVRVEANPASPLVADQISLNAVIGAWFEADVIDSTVLNAFSQGCERVLLVDNDSPDDTIARAVDAGAELARTFVTDDYDEQRRLDLMNDVVQEASAQIHRDEGTKSIWWLYLDADEFPRAGSGRTIKQYLATLDMRYRVVGARCLNHYPNGSAGHAPGSHPLDVQPLCEELRTAMCPLNHRKHPLMRWDLDHDPLASGLGFHKAIATETLIEPEDGIYLHHFPFREEGVTRSRLAALSAGGRMTDPDVTAHMRVRLESIDAVYRQDWAAVRNFMPGREAEGVTLVPWTELVPPGDHEVIRWY